MKQGMTMAGHEPQHGADDEDGDPPRTSIEQHQETFDAFMSLTKWAVLAVVLVLIGMAVFLL